VKQDDDERDERTDEEPPRRERDHEPVRGRRDRPDPFELDANRSGTFRIPRI
jgi:hypothetical protein